MFNAPLRSFCDVSVAELSNLAIRAPEESRRRAVDREGNLDAEAHADVYRIGDRSYELFPYPLRARGKEYYLVYFRDISDFVDLRTKLQREAPIVAYIVLDNLQELAQYVRVSYRSAGENIAMGYATGGLDYAGKLEDTKTQNFGAGGGTGLTLQPIGFLVINAAGEVEMLNVGVKNPSDPIEQIADIIERSPEIIARVKALLGKDKTEE